MQYTEFSLTSRGDLQIALTANGKERLAHLLAKYTDWNDDEVFLELIDEQLIKDWTVIPPEQIRATRALIILCNSAQYDQAGNVSHIESAFWHPSDLLGIVSKSLLKRGYVIFEKGRWENRRRP